MKKNLLLLGAMALLASCSQNSVEETFVSRQQISFDNLSNKATKAANDNNDDYQVYANTGLSTTANQWFIDDLVYGITTGEHKLDNAANGPYYWLNQTTNYEFYAFAPAASANIVKDVTYPKVNLTYTVPANGQEDFTIATPVKISTVPADGTVSLVFNHMLAKVNVTAVLSDALKTAKYSIEFGSATFIVAQNKGTVDAKADKATLAVAATGSTSATYTNNKSYMFMPQSAVNTTIQLKDVVITKAGVEHFKGDLTVYNIATGIVTDNVFAGGKEYNLAFTIDANATTPTNPDGTPNPGKHVFNIIKLYLQLIHGHLLQLH